MASVGSVNNAKMNSQQLEEQKRDALEMEISAKGKGLYFTEDTKINNYQLSYLAEHLQRKI